MPFTETGRSPGTNSAGTWMASARRSPICRPGRFGSSNALGAHLGLTPRVYQSGEIGEVAYTFASEGGVPIGRRSGPHRAVILNA
jgi:hypothetical protein